MQPSSLFRTCLAANRMKLVTESTGNGSNVRFFQTTSSKLDIDSGSFKVQDPKDFDERVKNSKVPVIVDFFATWCNPCRTLTPRLETIIAEQKGKVLLAKVDIDENTDLALDYEVGAVPVLLAIENGKVVQRLVGLQDTDKIRSFVDKVTKSSEDEEKK